MGSFALIIALYIYIKENWDNENVITNGEEVMEV
jgi:hypothetical protein